MSRVKTTTVKRAVLVALLLGTLLPGLGVGIYLARIEFVRMLDNEVHATLTREADVMALGVRESLWAMDTAAATALAEAVLQDPAIISVEVFDPNFGHLVQRELPERRSGEIHSLERTVMYRDAAIGKIRIELSDTPLRSALFDQVSRFGRLLLLQLVFSVALILYVLHRRVALPLRQLNEKAALLAHGVLDKAIVPARMDEIGRVESQLELTRQALRLLFLTLEQKNRTLEADITERTRVEAALRDREQHLAAIVGQSPLAVIEFDLDWRVLDWNAAANRMFGWTRAELAGQPATRLHAGPVQLPDITELNARSLSDAICTQQLECRRRDGQALVGHWYYGLVRDAAGTPQRIVAIVEDYTERQRSDEEIRRLATVVRLTNNLIALTDAAGIIIWANQAFLARFSDDLPLPGRRLGDILQASEAGESGAPIQAIDAAIESRRHLGELEIPCRDTAGRFFWVSVELQPIRDPDGIVTQWAALLTDVTERRHTADALRAIARLGGELDRTAFVDALLDIVLQACGAQAACLAIHEDDAVEIIAARSSSADWPIITGRHPGRTLLSRYTERTGALLLHSGAREALACDTACSGCRRAEALILEPLVDESQRVRGHLLLLFDAEPAAAEAAQSLAALAAARASTEFQRLLAIDALRHSELKFFSLFQHSPIPICVLRERDGCCLDVNPGFVANFGFAREAIVGRGLPDTPLAGEGPERLHAALASRSGASDADVVLHDAAGVRHDCQLHVRQIIVEEEDCLLVALVDVSSLLAARREIEELNQSLEQRVTERTQALAASKAELERTLNQLELTLDELVRSEKLAALGSLVAGVAHELNTPIGNSLMVASTLQDVNLQFREKMAEGLRRSTLDDYVAEISSAADILIRNLQRAAELISSFKQVAVDQTSSQRRQFDLAEVVGEIVVTMQPVLKKTNHRLENRIPLGLQMDSYPGPLGQVVANLLNNVLLHAFEGRENGRIELLAEADSAEHIYFHCRDDGVGITPANLKRIFDPFFTTRLGREGSGLGLNIAHNIVTGMLGGEISVESTPGKGSCFTLHLPRVAPRPKPAEAPTEA